jgi:hypothetical protein
MPAGANDDAGIATHASLTVTTFPRRWTSAANARRGDRPLTGPREGRRDRRATPAHARGAAGEALSEEAFSPTQRILHLLTMRPATSRIVCDKPPTVGLPSTCVHPRIRGMPTSHPDGPLGFVPALHQPWATFRALLTLAERR